MHQKTSVLEYFLSIKLQNKDLCFAVNFAKFLTKPNLWNICEGTSYLCENTISYEPFGNCLPGEKKVSLMFNKQAEKVRISQ